MTCWLQGGSPEQRLLFAFKGYDEDGNGGIDPKELTSLLLSITGKTVPEVSPLVDGIFSFYDTNHDGWVPSPSHFFHS